MSIFYSVSSLTDDPTGIKLIESPTSTIKAILFPRERLSDFVKLPEASQAGVYILYSTLDRNEQPYIRIGQSGYQIADLLAKHDGKKESWNQAFVFVEKGNFLSLNTAHTGIIESYLADKAKACGVSVMTDSTDPNPAKFRQSDKISAETWAKEIITITQLMGLTFLVPQTKPIRQPEPKPKQEPVSGAYQWQKGENPAAFRVSDRTPIPFTSWIRLLEDYCRELMEIVGPLVFADKVLSEKSFHTFRYNTFYSSEIRIEISNTICHKLTDNLYFVMMREPRTIRKNIELLQSLFPDIPFTYLKKL